MERPAAILLIESSSDEEEEEVIFIPLDDPTASHPKSKHKKKKNHGNVPNYAKPTASSVFKSGPTPIPGKQAAPGTEDILK